ncbi:MAG: MBOAT family O-acyltransferase [Bacteroidota bacterium]|nr:MBOAT family O-acyltransferase [Bacteroidota bacterium]
MCWKVEYIFLIIISTLIDYYASNKMGEVTEKTDKKRWLILSILTNLGLLLGFKYFNFASENIRLIFNQFNIFYETPLFNLLLPVGISFYTFQTLSYTIDVYNGKTPAEKHLGVFAVYVAFFPQLVAGPIERSHRLLPQFFQKHKFSYVRVKSGLQQMMWGFFKKVVIADRLAIIVDAIYNNPHDYSGFALLLATLFFTFQIYCDFSGYSDIAIGAAKVMGFELMENFKRPYFAKSISEFWRRWHISLSTWFRDYLYIPLGGNRVLKWRWYYNLFITFLISGLWHGANWTFIIWGALHGLYLISAIISTKPKNYIKNMLGIENSFIYKIWQVGSTFVLVFFAWIFFRANSINDAFYIIQNMFIDITDYTNLDIMKLKFRGLGVQINDIIICIFLIVVMEIYHLYERTGNVWEKLNSQPKILRWSVYYVIIFCILFLGPYTRVNNFIYFQF